MPTLLRIDVSPRGDWSVSKNVADAVQQAWQQKYNGTVVTRDITKGLPIVDVPWIWGAYTPGEQRNDQQKQALTLSDELIAELKSADHILIATPFWNFTLPAALTSYIDQVVRINETFSSSYEGLVKGKKAMIVRASGGAYGPGAYMEKMNHFDKPLKDILAFIGITDATIYAAENTNDVVQGKVKMEDYLAEHTKAAVAALVQ